MTDNKFQETLTTLAHVHSNYISLLKIAEDEIVRRYGCHPSYIDNDEWIDRYHQGTGHMTIEQLNKSMEDCGKKRLKK